MLYINNAIVLIGAIVGRFIFCYEPLGSLGAKCIGPGGTVSPDKESDDRKLLLVERQNGIEESREVCFKIDAFLIF
nr:CBM_HP1_G0009330.mRNA.1.CDS.1 [Saccharomyces cerevisiae]